MSVASVDPRVVYEARLAEHRRTASELGARQRLIANLRLACFAIAVTLVLLASRGNPELIPFIAIPTVAFVVLIFLHHRATTRCDRANRSVLINERGLANLNGSWPGTGAQGSQFVDLHHPFSEDLDLFGVGSLFERVCAARTPSGQSTLANWFLVPSDVAELRLRQAAVAELREKVEFREELAILAGDVDHSVDADRLLKWAEAPIVPFPRWARSTALILSFTAVATLLSWLALGLEARWFFLVILLELIFSGVLYRKVHEAIAGIEQRAEQLSVLAGLLRRIESEPFESPWLLRLKEALSHSGESPSTRLAKLARLADLLEARKNQMFLPISWLLLWTTQIAIALQAWRRASGASIAGWVAVVGQLEALASLAGFAFENPSDPFPQLEPDAVVFEAEGLGHPLIDPVKCVRNDLSLGRGLQVLVVSGSNMSGKSTLLRSVGTNAVLALAGGTVRAERLRISPVALGATLRVRDSLQEGHSRFYAELVRLKQLVDLAKGDRPLLFLLDEILHGTNSHDRKIGAQSLVRGLVELGAIGLVTTHDLALAETSSSLGDRALNVHFADHLEEGRMIFDFKMRPGVVQHSNALALMRAVGLDVPTPANATRQP